MTVLIILIIIAGAIAVVIAAQSMGPRVTIVKDDETTGGDDA